MQDFKKLKVWQKAHSLTVNIYKITSNFPNEEKFGLTNQIRRATVSIESNIAEGCGRNGDKEFSRFLEQQAELASVAWTRLGRYSALRSG